ncbi:MAG: CRISPR-associated endonuclease Cas1, partial [Planctomycetota bacterium]
MIERIIDISDGPAHLHVRNGLLVIERDGEEPATVPLPEIAALVVAHPGVTFTQSVVSGLAEAGASLLTCDSRFLPAAIMLPMQAHFVQTERLALQVGASLPTCKRLWKQVVRAKIAAQAAVLTRLHGSDSGISGLISRVRSGDPRNVEA